MAKQIPSIFLPVGELAVCLWSGQACNFFYGIPVPGKESQTPVPRLGTFLDSFCAKAFLDRLLARSEITPVQHAKFERAIKLDHLLNPELDRLQAAPEPVATHLGTILFHPAKYRQDHPEQMRQGTFTWVYDVPPKKVTKKEKVTAKVHLYELGAESEQEEASGSGSRIFHGALQNGESQTIDPPLFLRRVHVSQQSNAGLVVFFETGDLQSPLNETVQNSFKLQAHGTVLAISSKPLYNDGLSGGKKSGEEKKEDEKKEAAPARKRQRTKK